MLDNIKNCVNEYLNRTINMDQFIEKMNHIYGDIIRSKNACYNLDIIPIINYVHLFAFWEWSNVELDQKVEKFQAMILGNVNYNYSAFVKLISDISDIDSLSELDSISQDRLKEMFTQRVNPPITVKDVIHNTIYDLICNTDFCSVEDSDWECVNCGDDIELWHIRNTLHRLISYYRGASVFYLQISYDINSGYIYTVI